MSRRARWVFAACLVAVAVFAPAQPASAHGGGDATSNYRTRVDGVQPAVDGLAVRLFDVQGTIELTYSGTGTLVVIGYEGEPYLRIGTDGVQRNIHSPATYLNQDRYARTALPAIADAQLPPEWQQISSGHTVAFHDHRTHWMSTVPPAQVAADPDAVTVIFDRWEIPLTIDGTSASITGDLSWVPAPSSLPWVASGVVLAVAAATALVLLRWQRVAVAIAVVGTAVLCIDTVGYLRAGRFDGAQRAWLVGWPLAAIAATIAVMVVGRRRTSAIPSGFIALAALIVAAIGGWDRIDVIQNSQLQSTNPDWFTRAAAVTCVALGTTLLVRFLVDLVPRALGPRHTSIAPDVTS